jgi:(2S)-methylsuccinyl-CoA dehydrogenase
MTEAPPALDPERIVALADRALAAAARFREAAAAAARARTVVDGRLDASAMDREQHAIHGFAWVATTVAALEALLAWARDNSARGSFYAPDAGVLALAFAEYLGQLSGGLPMSGLEMFRPAALGLGPEAAALAADPAVVALAESARPPTRALVTAHVRHGGMIAETLADEVLDLLRDQFRRFATERILPHAHQWHLEDALVPDTLIAELAAMGTFGICIAPEHGGLGLGRLAMCVATEELSRGWIAAGSLGTRAEIAAELIAMAGTPHQQQRWLPALASGSVLPTAVFTEPGAGSDLAGIATRAERQADGSWRISGAKMWITHAARTDLMTLLARTGGPGSGGLSMFLAEKPRGTRADPFPVAGLSGGELPVLGYRGMREYELAFDGFVVAADGLLGDRAGEGFRQLMRTFEGARIQTAARAVGVGRRAFELGLRYAIDRRQFGRPLVDFARVSDKLAMMLAELTAARELSYAAARAKDSGRRSDVEAGMAKLLAARMAFASADGALQIHGGNGYALESEISRILCDARILSIFEGSAEIQAHVIARGLLVP